MTNKETLQATLEHEHSDVTRVEKPSQMLPDHRVVYVSGMLRHAFITDKPVKDGDVVDFYRLTGDEIRV